MSARPEPSERLLRLERILARTTSALRVADGAGAPAENVHLASIPLERIREITVELEQRSGEDADAIDAVAIRLLLNDYAAAVAHLRAVARLAEQRVEAASKPVEQAVRLVQRQMKVKKTTHGRS